MDKQKQKTQTLSLGDYWNGFIASQIETGRYTSASQLVRDALRMLEENEANSKLHALRVALIEGENSGDTEKLDMQSIRNEAKKEL